VRGGKYAMTGRLLAAVLGVALAGGTASAAAAATPPCSTSHWVSGWSAPPGYATAADVGDATLRMGIRPNTGGGAGRLRLSNRYGSAPVTFSRVVVARRAEGAALVPGSARELRFDGKASVTIAPGEDARSDTLDFEVAPRQDLAVSMAVKGDPGEVTAHLIARTTSYLTAEGAGDRAAEESPIAFTQTTGSWFYVAGLEVEAPGRVGTLAAIGDSTTDGFQGQNSPATESPADFDTNARWPDFFAARSGTSHLAVTSAAISGNRLLRDALLPGYGEALVKRLEADVLRLPAVTDAVLLEGINDIGQGEPGNPAFPAPTAGEQIEAYKSIVARLHAAGIRVHLATLTPAGGTVVRSYGGDDPNQRRERVNAWIRSERVSDGVIGSDAALRDPAAPSRLKPE